MAGCNPKLSVGILAHNEEFHIGETLRSLFAQDVFQQYDVELIIVANGCTDRTVETSRRLLNENEPVWSARGSARVEEITISGKANAWNEFVHRLSSSEAPILVLMDADIVLLNTEAISSMVATLQADSHAVICVDRAVKDLELKDRRTIFQRLLIGVTPSVDSNNVPLCGQLYCGLSAALRHIKLPEEITCEDGFLRALVLTRGFTSPEDTRRIVRDANASHIFASVATLAELFKHEKWIVAGNIVNALLFERFWAEARADKNAMMLMSDWKAANSRWLPDYIRSEVGARRWQLLPSKVWTRRWSRLRGRPIWSKVARFPIASIAAAVDAVIFVAAIIDVRRGRAFRYWGRT